MLSKHQHGFVPGRSCFTQLVEVMDNWTEVICAGGRVDAIYMDFQKAFDTVPHRRLLLKAEAMGIRGNILKWIQSFLQHRQQCVVINGTYSSWAPVTSELPQGSVLGPVLVVLYINDLPVGITLSVKMFADDTKLYNDSSKEQGTQTLQDDLEKLQDWSDLWLLKFHPDKCCILKLGNPKSEADYYMKGKSNHGEECTVQLKESEREKDLGIIVDRDLTFKDHITQAANTARSIVGVIRRTFDYIDNSLFLQLYKSLVRPKLEYGHILWNTSIKHLQQELENVQRAATRLVPNLKDKDYPERLKALKLPSLEHRRRRGDLIEAFKYIRGFYDVSRPHFDSASGKSLSTRGNSLKLNKHQHGKGKSCSVRNNFFTERIFEDWNSLSDEVVLAPTINAFKDRLDKFWLYLPSRYMSEQLA